MSGAGRAHGGSAGSRLQLSQLPVACRSAALVKPGQPKARGPLWPHTRGSAAKGSSAAAIQRPHASLGAPPLARPWQVRVANTAALIRALSLLPHGQTTSPDVPDLQPIYEGKPPARDATKFVIKSWQVRRGPAAAADIQPFARLGKQRAAGVARH